MNGRIAPLGALVAICAIALAGILFVTGEEALQRLALLFAMLGVIIPGILSLLKQDAIARTTDDTNRRAITTLAKVDGHLGQLTEAATGVPAEVAERIAADKMTEVENGG